MRGLMGVLPVLVMLSTPARADWLEVFDEITEDDGVAEVQLGRQPAGGLQLSRELLTLGLRETLVVGSERAVSILARPGGFGDDERVRIRLPHTLYALTPRLRQLGVGEQVDAFAAELNAVAERAVVAATPVLRHRIAQLNFHNLRQLHAGNADEATRFLRTQLEPELQAQVARDVQQALQAVGATDALQRLLTRLAASTGHTIPPANLTEYVTQQTINGLFAKLSDAERQIRHNPSARSTALLKHLWGS